MVLLKSSVFCFMFIIILYFRHCMWMMRYCCVTVRAWCSLHLCPQRLRWSSVEFYQLTRWGTMSLLFLSYLFPPSSDVPRRRGHKQEELMNTFFLVYFLCLCPLGLGIKLNFNIVEVVLFLWCLPERLQPRTYLLESLRQIKSWSWWLLNTCLYPWLFLQCCEMMKCTVNGCLFGFWSK